LNEAKSICQQGLVVDETCNEFTDMIKDIENE